MDSARKLKRLASKFSFVDSVFLGSTKNPAQGEKTPGTGELGSGGGQQIGLQRPLPSRASLRRLCPHCGRCKRGSTRWSYLQAERLHLQSPKSSALFPDFRFFHCFLRSMHDVFGVPIIVAISSMYKVFPDVGFKQVGQAPLIF